MLFKNRFAVALLILAVGAAGAFAAMRVLRKPTPLHFADTAGLPVEVTPHGEGWFWIQRPVKDKARLVRASGSRVDTVTTADEIIGYAVDNDKVAWTAREGKRWTVVVETFSGEKRTVWTGSTPASNPNLSGTRTVWAVTQPGLLPESAPMAALTPSLLVFVDDNAQTSKPVTLPEANGRMLGLFGDKTYVASERKKPSHAAVIYEVRLTDGKWRRIAGEQGLSVPAARPEGGLFWVGRSQDSSNRGDIACVRSLSPSTGLSTLADWLPAGGLLYTVGTETFYVVENPSPDVWPIRSNAELVSPLTLPEGYKPVAVGPHTILLRTDQDPGGAQRLYVMRR